MPTPVAFIIFNRPDKARRIFESIRAYRPARLLVIADGPRPDRPGEDERCRETRAIIDQVDWPCAVDHCFSETNLGCKRRLASGLDWVFQQTEEAIILEDDCLPHPSFFPYCDALLERYRHDASVGLISGDQYLPRRSADSYRFSLYNPIWGWASWRRAWRLNDLDMKAWPARRASRWLRDLCSGAEEAAYWRAAFDSVHSGRLDTWDYQWHFSLWHHGLKSIVPSVNLVSNIGFDTQGTHTRKVNNLANLPTFAMDAPLVHPTCQDIDTASDHEAWRVVYRGRLRSRIKRLALRCAAMLRQ